MNGKVATYSVEGAKYGISFGTALAIAISYTNNHSVLWGDHSRFIQLALRDLLRAVLSRSARNLRSRISTSEA